jgi:hypothetical protein
MNRLRLWSIRERGDYMQTPHAYGHLAIGYRLRFGLRPARLDIS